MVVIFDDLLIIFPLYELRPDSDPNTRIVIIICREWNGTQSQELHFSSRSQLILFVALWSSRLSPSLVQIFYVALKQRFAEFFIYLIVLVA